MSDEASIVRAGFVRQRRNLLIASVVLLVFQNTGATINTLNVFGNTVTLSAPLNLSLPLWLAWLYFLVRYYQYLRDLGDKGFHAAYLTRWIELGKAQAVKQLKRIVTLPVEDLENPEPADYDIKGVLLGATPPLWVYNVAGSVTVRQKHPQEIARNQNLGGLAVRVPDRRMIIPRIRAIWWVVAHTRLTTEYILPFVVAALPLVYAIARSLSR